jgi:hypothetical protein
LAWYQVLICVPRVLQSREARIRNPEDVANYGSVVLQHYKKQLAEEECEYATALAAAVQPFENMRQKSTETTRAAQQHIGAGNDHNCICRSLASMQYTC